MPAKRRAWEKDILSRPDLLRQMASAVGESYHIIDPSTFADNLADFAAVFDECGVTGRIRYGYKANKARAFVRACADAAAVAPPSRYGVDVASAEEFGAALAAGVRGEEVMVTGPAHSDDVLRLAARHRALVALDTVEQVSRVLEHTPTEHLNILLRMRPDDTTTRFGISGWGLQQAIADLQESNRIVLRGFSFHLSGYEVWPRVSMAHRAIDACQRAREVGHPADIVSIGGGIAVDYVEHRDWDTYRARESGEWYFDGKTAGSLYPYSTEVAGAAMLERILCDSDATHPECVGVRARSSGLSIMIEPGRALCDGAGVSVFTVRGVHTHTDGTDIITVSGTSMSLSEQWFDSEFLPDPELVDPRDSQPRTDTPIVCHPAIVAGATCLDSDLLSRRRIPFSRRARVGDLIVYPNTAGYQMDSNESEFHQVPVPPKLILHRQASPTTWSIDR